MGEQELLHGYSPPSFCKISPIFLSLHFTSLENIRQAKPPQIIGGG
jgi:hypothetical protein